MTEQQKSSVKIVSTMILILVLPILFFQLIGENPTKQMKNATRNIAVVNEDVGASESENTARFGQDVVAALSERPDYTWTVVNRSAADNGLRNRKYDAVLYIPSDFSKNVLSYDKDQPEKASIEFAIQDQLNSVNKEKVQRELENAQKKMNEQMSTLYWSFVSQEIGNVREEFDKIVGKEIEFQNTMYNFYKPSSNKLADAVLSQKKQIEDLKKAMTDSQQSYQEGLSTTEGAKKQLKDFIDVVKQYKDYQEKQKDLLVTTQSANTKQIQKGLTALSDLQNQNARSFSEQMSGLKTEMNGVQSQLRTTDSSVLSLQKAREQAIPVQSNGLKDLMKHSQEELIKKYEEKYLAYIGGSITNLQEKIKSSRRELVNTSPDPTDPKDPGKDQEDDDSSKELKINLDEETNELSNISSAIDEIADQLKGQEEPSIPPSEEENPEESESTQSDDDPKAQSDDDPKASDNEQQKEALKALAVQLEEVKKSIQNKTTEHNDQLQGKLDQLSEEVKDLTQKLEKLEKKYTEINQKYDKNFTDIQNKINRQEASIANKLSNMNKKSSSLTAYTLKPEYFMRGFSSHSKDTTDLINYSSQLSQYEAILDTFYEGPNKYTLIDQKEDNIKSILAIQHDETESWEYLKNNMLTSNEDVESFIEGMRKFTDGYAEFISKQQSNMEQELNTISDSADKVAEQIADNGDAVYTADLASSSIVVSAQDSIGNEVLRLSENMSSLTDRQNGVAEYTQTIEQSVTTVQEKADTLNENWSKNVDSTKLIKNDLYSILGNTLDDQANSGYVYNYLANPLKISGDVPEEKTQTVPPVVILVIIMISSLLIGYFSSYYANAPMLVKAALFGILNILVGLMISLFGLNIYALADDQAIKWSIFTILLLIACSAFIRTAFLFGAISGWTAATVLIFFFVAPLIDLVMPNFYFTNPVTDIYISLQYGSGDEFGMGITGLLILTAVLMIIPLVVKLIKSKAEESDATHEA
ncbi:type VII secretion protein EsaA [Bacillus sp. NPDC077027]|uniref:type VII secretion protein EsaA n=1 Tax=Bacillus sp. NPDC077027 TaxID=3390548 RepID=UPI003D06CA0A